MKKSRELAPWGCWDRLQAVPARFPSEVGTASREPPRHQRATGRLHRHGTWTAVFHLKERLPLAKWLGVEEWLTWNALFKARPILISLVGLTGTFGTGKDSWGLLPPREQRPEEKKKRVVESTHRPRVLLANKI